MNSFLRSTLSLLACLLVFLPYSNADAQPSRGMTQLHGVQSYGGFRDVAVAEDGTVYIAAGYSGLLVLEPNDRHAYNIINQIGENEDSYSFCELNGNQLYLRCTNHLYLYDVTNTSQPELVNSYDTDYTFVYYSCWDGDEYIYVYSFNFQVYRLLDNDRVELVFEYTPFDDRSVYELKFHDSILYGVKYLDGGTYQLKAWGCQDPEYPNEIQTVDQFLPGYDFFIKDNLLVSAGGREVLVYDISNPYNIVFHAEYVAPEGTYYSNARIIGNYIYVNKSYSDYHYAFELSDSNTLVLVDSAESDLFYNSTNSVVLGQNVYTPYGTGGLRTVEMDDQPFGTLSIFDPVDEWGNFVLCDDIALVNGDGQGPKAYRIDEAGSISYLGAIEEDSTLYVDVQGNNKVLLYGNSGGGGVQSSVDWYHIVVPDENEPLGVRLGNGLLTSSCTVSKNFDEWIYLFSYGYESDTLYVVNATDAMNPFIDTSFVFSDMYYYDVLVHEEYLYVVCADDNRNDYYLQTYSLQDPAVPELVHSLDLDYCWGNLTISGDLLFFHNPSSAPMLYSLEDPAAPEYVCTMDVEADEEILDYRDGFLIMKYYDTSDNPDFKVYIYDCRDSFEYPVPVAYTTLPHAVFDARFVSDNLVFASWSTGYGIYEWEVTAAEESQFSLLPDTPQMQAYPNPANPETRITLELPQAEAVKVCVYDVLGREVARLHEGVLHAGSHAFHFGSQPGLASGVYFVQAIAGQWETAQRIVLLK